MFRFWKWMPQDIDQLILDLSDNSYESNRLAELMESYNLLHYETDDIFLQYRRDETLN